MATICLFAEIEMIILLTAEIIMIAGRETIMIMAGIQNVAENLTGQMISSRTITGMIIQTGAEIILTGTIITATMISQSIMTEGREDHLTDLISNLSKPILLSRTTGMNKDETALTGTGIIILLHHKWKDPSKVSHVNLKTVVKGNNHHRKWKDLSKVSHVNLKIAVRGSNHHLR
jgi:hypothetical protein